MTEFTKENPFPAKIRERYPLNREGSSKKTYHLSLDLSGAGMEYKVGDAVGIFPENRAEDVEALLEALDCSGNESVVDPRSGAELSFETYLKTGANLLRVPTPLLKLKGDPSLLGEENKEARSQYIAQRDLISFFEETKNPLPLQELISYFAPMLPRFYSIASSPKVSPNSVDLLIATFSYEQGGKVREGIGSQFLCHAASIQKTSIPTYLHPTPHFSLPKDPNTSIIMIGPGTGVAPYRAFLQEREALGAKGKNWLFFGERNRAYDYYYEAYLESLVKKGFLKLDLAFSRDKKEKCYVQHLLLKQGKEVWDELQNGAYLYICGDARHMAKDVISAIQTIAETYGSLSPEEGKSYLKTMRCEKRLLMDVY